MKKIYLEPEIDVISLNTEKHLLQTSSLGAGDDWTSGEAAAPGQREDLEIFLFQLMGL